jgi:hypothetical protein
MKKLIMATIFVLLIGMLTFTLVACNLGGLGDKLGGLMDGLDDGGEGVTLEYDADYIAEHLTGDYDITYRVSSYEAGELPTISNQRIIRSTEGYYFETSEESGDSKQLFIKSGDSYYPAVFDEDEDKYVVSSSATAYTQQDMNTYATSFLGFMTQYAGMSGLVADGTETVVGRNCERYKYSLSLMGLAGMSYIYSIDPTTGVCLKFVTDVSAGGDKVGAEFLCTEFKTSNVTLPEYEPYVAENDGDDDGDDGDNE